MSSVAIQDSASKSVRPSGRPVSRRAAALAERLEQGAFALAAFATTLSDAQWQTRVPHDGRKVGVMVHHVANMYPLEIQIAQLAASGEAVTPTWEMVATINAKHAQEFDRVTKAEALEALKTASEAAAAAIRALSDEELDRAVPVAFDSNAPLTCQFVLEDHAVRHSYHHLAKMKKALEK